MKVKAWHERFPQVYAKKSECFQVTVEKQYQALCESWRLELEEKQRQFEQVKGQILGPRDLELMRVAMMEKVEAPFRAKCDLLARVRGLLSTQKLPCQRLIT